MQSITIPNLTKTLRTSIPSRCTINTYMCTLCYLHEVHAIFAVLFEDYFHKSMYTTLLTL